MYAIAESTFFTCFLLFLFVFFVLQFIAFRMCSLYDSFPLQIECHKNCRVLNFLTQISILISVSVSASVSTQCICVSISISIAGYGDCNFQKLRSDVTKLFAFICRPIVFRFGFNIIAICTRCCWCCI